MKYMGHTYTNKYFAHLKFRTGHPVFYLATCPTHVPSLIPSFLAGPRQDVEGPPRGNRSCPTFGSARANRRSWFSRPPADTTSSGVFRVFPAGRLVLLQTSCWTLGRFREGRGERGLSPN